MLKVVVREIQTDLIDIGIFHFLGGRVGFLATTQKLFDIELSSRFQMKAKRYGQFLKSLTSWFFSKMHL